MLPIIDTDSVIKETIIDKKIDPFYNGEDNEINDINSDNLIIKNKNKSEHTYYFLICDKKGFMKVLNFNGIFNHYFKNYKKKIETNSNFNILKKEDVDIEPTMNHLLKNSRNKQKKVYDQPYVNLYATNIINREWRGHSDYITNVEFVEDPISTITISKDKYLRIWNEKFELIGEINVIPDENVTKFIKEKKVEWKFKVNEKKLLEKEVNEIVYILENIDIKEETKIIRGSQIDKDFNDPEKYEIDEKEGLIKKRNIIKKVEEEKIIKKNKLDFKSYSNSNNNKEDNNYQSNYEAILLKNISNKIETIIKNKPQNEGMGEISNNLMTSILENKNKKIKLLKTLNSKLIEFNKTNTKNDNNDNAKEESRRPSIKSIKKNKSKSNLLFINNNQDGDISPKSFKHSTIKVVEDNRKSILDHKKNLKIQLKFKEKAISNKKIISNKTSYGEFIINKAKKGNKKLKLNNQKEYLKESKSKNNQFNNTFSEMAALVLDKKSTSVHKSNYCLNRNNLYAEKFAYKPLYNEKEENEKKKNILPNIISKYLKENIKINNLNLKLNYEVREKTDDLIKTQYYLNNYKNCCRINANNSDFSTNKSNMFNCKNMWNDIISFTKDIIVKEEKMKKNLNNLGKYKKLYKSKSVVNIRKNE